ncbi:unnamed protein product [Rhizophagus irregularis]|uniref:Uncharacterized protein n=1 Tax=Rhizophagus irregularis TaxID=588596 RepID=A0A915YZ18_9GLOM|nr:unnamed protein product [Rhizophagus irregularis]CAB5353871.1 unnamed protein product [Rhizophagus irregularis]
MKDCLDSGIENDADLNILRFNGFMSTQWTLYDRSHLKNVYDDPYRLISFATSPIPLLIRLIKSTLDIVLTDHCYSQNRKVRNTTRRSHFYPVESKREAQVATLTESCSP